MSINRRLLVLSTLVFGATLLCTSTANAEEIINPTPEISRLNQPPEQFEPMKKGFDPGPVGDNVNRCPQPNKMPPSFSNENNFRNDQKNDPRNGGQNFGDNESMGSMRNSDMNKNMNSENNKGNFNMNMNSEQGDMMGNSNINSEQNEEMNTKREAERQAQQEKQMVQNAQRQIKGMEQGLKQFDRQLASLTKQKITIPAEITASLAKIKLTIAGVKTAKTDDDLTAAGWEDLFEEMNTLRESQELLQQLSRWPQTLKQVDRQLANFNRELKKAKTIVDRLQKKSWDVSTLYSDFESSIASLKAVRDEAVAAVAAGKVEDAFTLLEDKFFGASEDIMEKQRILQTMNSMSKFADQFKRGSKEMDKIITQLKRKKIDTTELEQLKATVIANGEKVKELVKTPNFDVETLMITLQDLENDRQEFMAAAQALMGESDQMPWEQPGNTKSNTFAVPSFNNSQL